MPDQFPHDIDITFVATITTDTTSGWTCAPMSGSRSLLGTGKAVKIAGTIDGHIFGATLLPVGGGTHMVPLRAALRKTIDKGIGDEVTIHLVQRLT